MDNVFIERVCRSLKHDDIYLTGCVDRHEERVGIASWIASLSTKKGPFPHFPHVCTLYGAEYSQMLRLWTASQFWGKAEGIAQPLSSIEMSNHEASYSQECQP